MADRKEKQLHIRLSEEAEQILLQIQEEKGFRSVSNTLEFILLDYANNCNVADVVSAKVSADLSKVLTRIRLGTNTADVNSQIIIELLNSIIFQFGVKPMTTAQEETVAVGICRSEVKEKLANMKQKKDSKSRGEQ